MKFYKICSVYLYRAALFEVILVIHKDVLFHCHNKKFYSTGPMVKREREAVKEIQGKLKSIFFFNLDFFPVDKLKRT